MISERVARGVALLDSVEPGWFHRINVDALDVSQYDRCVLGQLYRDYSFGIKALGILPREQAAEHGFQVEYIARAPLEYQALTQEWRRVIEILRQETGAKVTVKLKELVLV